MVVYKEDRQVRGSARQRAETPSSPHQRESSSESPANSQLTKPSPAPRSKILRTRDLVERLGVSRTTIWRWERAKLLPRRRKIGPNVVGWIEEEFERFVHSLPTPESEGTEQ